MSIFLNGVLSVYVIALTVVTCYCLMQLQLLYKYRQWHRKPLAPLWAMPDILPFVTIQLPIYNEMYVVERLIDNMMKMDYPKERFEVHILDDSTDETTEITRQKVEEYTAKGFNIRQLQRTNRKGYKAGALKDSMQFAKGEFIAIFDADFLPRADFLMKTLPYFQDEKTGVVQTRWEHINESYSLLTRLQALQLNVHFRVEQQGRKAGNYLLQFNGTAGVWRRKTIDDAGGWEADTLTEDLDLSIRAQLRGWQIAYLEEVGSPAELPSEMNGLKSQQFRWMKGGAETAKKMLPTVWRSRLTFPQKIHVTMQLAGSTVFPFVFLMGVFSVPVLIYMGGSALGTAPMTWCLVGLVAFLAVQYVANVEAPSKNGGYLKSLLKFIFLFPLFMALSMGLSLHNTVAVLQGWLGKQSAFIRTPKFNIQGIRDTFRKQDYLSSKISWTTIFEGGLALYFLWAMTLSVKLGNFSFLLMHGLLTLGYGAIFFYTLRHIKYR